MRAGSATNRAVETKRMRRYIWFNRLILIELIKSDDWKSLAHAQISASTETTKTKIYSILAESTICLDHWNRETWLNVEYMSGAFTFHFAFDFIIFFTWEPNSTVPLHSLILLVRNYLFGWRQNLLSCNKFWQRLLKSNTAEMDKHGIATSALGLRAQAPYHVCRKSTALISHLHICSEMIWWIFFFHFWILFQFFYFGFINT